MSSRNLSLFGEELPPEQMKAVGKSRAIPKKEKTEEKAPKADKKDPKPSLLEGWDANKQYYSIGEVADLFKVKTSHIRFWTNEFALKVRTTRKGDRLFTPEQIRELLTIHHLVKEKGYTIAGAKAKLKEKTKVAVGESLDLKKSLLKLRNQLVTMRNQLGK